MFFQLLCFSLPFRCLFLLLLPHSNQSILLQQFRHVRRSQVSSHGTWVRVVEGFIHESVSHLRTKSHLSGHETFIHDGRVRHLQPKWHELVRGDVGTIVAGHRVALCTHGECNKSHRAVGNVTRALKASVLTRFFFAGCFRFSQFSGSTP
jgi:hypothetical protein